MKYASFLFVIVLIAFHATSVFAAEGLVTCTGGDDCNFCSLVDMVNGLIEWLIIIAVSLTVLLLAFAGFRLITSRGDAAGLEQAKKILVSSFIGILIMLAGWTVVDTFLKVVAGGDLGVWNAVECGGAHTSAPATDINIELIATDGVDLGIVASFTGDHGDGVGLAAGPDVIVGSGGNCPGASASEVAPIPGESGKFLRKDVVQNFVDMRTAAAADGITLRVTSAWRSQATQEAIWSNHHCDALGCSGTVARPCSKGGNGSNHNGGVAVDISGSSRGSAIYNWLKTNGGRYGFNNNLGPDDPVHWSPTGR